MFLQVWFVENVVLLVVVRVPLAPVVFSEAIVIEKSNLCHEGEESDSLCPLNHSGYPYRLCSCRLLTPSNLCLVDSHPFLCRDIVPLTETPGVVDIDQIFLCHIHLSDISFRICHHHYRTYPGDNNLPSWLHPRPSHKAKVSKSDGRLKKGSEIIL